MDHDETDELPDNITVDENGTQTEVDEQWTVGVVQDDGSFLPVKVPSRAPITDLTSGREALVKTARTFHAPERLRIVRRTVTHIETPWAEVSS